MRAGSPRQNDFLVVRCRWPVMTYVWRSALSIFHLLTRPACCHPDKKHRAAIQQRVSHVVEPFQRARGPVLLHINRKIEKCRQQRHHKTDRGGGGARIQSNSIAIPATNSTTPTPYAHNAGTGTHPGVIFSSGTPGANFGNRKCSIL